MVNVAQSARVSSLAQRLPRWRGVSTIVGHALPLMIGATPDRQPGPQPALLSRTYPHQFCIGAVHAALAGCAGLTSPMVAVRNVRDSRSRPTVQPACSNQGQLTVRIILDLDEPSRAVARVDMAIRDELFSYGDLQQCHFGRPLEAHKARRAWIAPQQPLHRTLPAAPDSPQLLSGPLEGGPRPTGSRPTGRGRSGDKYVTHRAGLRDVAHLSEWGGE